MSWETEKRLELMKKYADDMISTYEKKNTNYKGSFTKTIEELGIQAGLVPLYNKVHRATALIKEGNNNFESIDDTLRDLATYSFMLLAELDIERCSSKDFCCADRSNHETDNDTCCRRDPEDPFGDCY